MATEPTTAVASTASFTFDVDGEASWLAMDPDNVNRPGLLSQGIYGPKVGVPLILKLLAQHGVRATFFVPGLIADRYKDTVAAIAEAGHELAVHGYTHTPPTLLTAAEEQDELDRALEVLRAFTPTVVGYRSPSWDIGPNTLRLLEERDFLYASQFMDDIRPYRHRGLRMLELPVQWLLDDWPHFAWFPGESARCIKSTAEVETIWCEEFRGIRKLGGSYILTMHPQVIGRPSRVDLLDRMLTYVRSFDDVDILTCLEIARRHDGLLPADDTSSRP
jgi:peptidoglycan/xylan/chitin deacetylase (PgdA/CDA1 family)